MENEAEVVWLVGGPEGGGKRYVRKGTKELYVVMPIAGLGHYHLIYQRDDVASNEMRFVGDDYHERFGGTA